MNTKRLPNRWGGVVVALVCAPTLASAQDLPDPTDASAKVPETVYRSVFTAPMSAEDAAPLPWKRLFKPDGTFVPERELAAGAMAARPESMGGRSKAKDEASSGPSIKSGTSDARGTVKSINKEQGKVKLKHGPIDKFEMPGMTMVFRVSEPALLDQVSEDDDVGFTIEQQGSAFVITGFQRGASEAVAPAMPKGASDSRGVVRGIDKEQGKVKLKHGPIDKYEMPGMTMVFRVADPALLDQISEGDEVGFTVDQVNSAFVVSGFQR